MAVHVHRERDAAMAQALTDDLRMDVALELFVAIFSVKADGTVVTENAAKYGCTEKPARYREADRALVLAGKKREKREALCNVRHMRWAS